MPLDDSMLSRAASARIPTALGEFQLFLYKGGRDDKERLALVKGEVAGQKDVLVRVHSHCFTGDVLGSRRCHCGAQLRGALELIAGAGAGVVIYLCQEGRGPGLLARLKAYNLQDQGDDTVDADFPLGHQADEGDYAAAAQILKDLGVRSLKLLTNDPRKIDNLQEAGLELSAIVPLETGVDPENAGYLRTKAPRLKQLLVLEELPNGAPCYQPLQLGIMEEINLSLSKAGEHRRQSGRPLVTLSYAQSLDGSIAARPGRPLALSGSKSMALTHGLRAAHDAILVGIGTLLADNPRLNVRLVEGKDPQPVVVDSRLRFPPYANLLRNCRPPWIAAGEDADRERQAALEETGARVLRLPSGANGWVDLTALLERLGEMGVDSLMVEGGAQIITSFLAARLVDQVVLTIAPMLVGGLRVMDYLGQAQGNCFPRLHRVSYQRLGEDLVLRGEPQWEG